MSESSKPDLSAPDAFLPSLLDLRLVVVTGKGGTGKSSIAAALAWAAARAGKRTIAVEVGREERVPQLLRPAHEAQAPLGEVGDAGREIAPGLHALRVDPFIALAEYFALQLGGRALVDRVVRAKAFRQLMNAAPGWRELITLGKIWHLESQTRDDGSPLWDFIVVDAPATGHGLTFLDVPHVAVTAIRGGPLRRHAEAVEALLCDVARTRLLPVSLPEELPVRETLELLERLRTELRIHVDRVVANAVSADVDDAGIADLVGELTRFAEGGGDLPASLPTALELAECATHVRARRRLHEDNLALLREQSAVPVVEIPALEQQVGCREDIEALQPALLAPIPLPRITSSEAGAGE